MIPVGIDTLSIYSSPFALDLASLAVARAVDPEKYLSGLGQRYMGVPAPDEDIVTMGAAAAAFALRDIDIQSIEMVLFATESGIDQSKSAGIYVHDLLGLPARCRVVELKQACYSATAALQLALPFLKMCPDKKILLIASDIARYGFNTPGESSQGCGAVAMVLSSHPRIVAFEPEYGVITENVMDFWRPNYSDAAFVEGKYSSRLYLHLLEKTWQQYYALSQRALSDHDYFCYHASVPRLVEKAHQHLLKVNGLDKQLSGLLAEQIDASLHYGRQMGNSYTASLYIGLASLLDLIEQDMKNKRIGFYSYGSGCVAEFFSGIVQPSYRAQLNTSAHRSLFSNRTILSYPEYESFYTFPHPKDGSSMDMPVHQTTGFRLAAIRDHKRIYEAV